MAALTDIDPIPFGKHEGECMEDVPAQYLLFFWTDRREWLRMKQYGVYEYIRTNLASIKMDAEAEEENHDRFMDILHEDWGDRD